MNVLEFLMVASEHIENQEGVVITFANGKMAKQKHQWYMSVHGLLSEGLREHKLIDKVLNEEIDDVLAHIPVDAYEEREFINALSDVIIHHVNQVATEAYNLFNDNFDGDRKAFAIKYLQHPLFKLMTVLFQENSFEHIEKRVIKEVLKNTRKWNAARDYLKELGFERELRLVDND